MTDNDGLQWKVASSEDKKGIVLLREGARVPLPEFSCLSPDLEKRLDWFDREAEKYELHDSRAKYWREILSARAVDDEEVDLLLSEIRLTPPLYVLAAQNAPPKGSGKLHNCGPMSRDCPGPFGVKCGPAAVE